MSSLKTCASPGCPAVLVAVHSDSIFDGAGLRRSDYCSPCWQKVVAAYNARARAREEHAASNPPPPRRPSAAELAAAREQKRLEVRLESQELRRQSDQIAREAGVANDPNERDAKRIEAANMRERAEKLLESVTTEPKEELTDREREAAALNRKADLLDAEAMATSARNEAGRLFRAAAGLRAEARRIGEETETEGKEEL